MERAGQTHGTYEHPAGRVAWWSVGDGPPVVLCHGTPWSSFVWTSLASHLPHRRAIAWDMPGFGRSERSPQVDLATQAQVLADLLDHLGLDRPDIVAHDIGGAVALRAHLLHQRPVASLVLVDVVALRPWGSPFFRLVRDSSAVFGALPANLHRALVAEYIRGASATQLGEHDLTGLVDPWLGSNQASFYLQIAQADESHTIEFEDRLGEIEVPTLVAWGSADSWIPVEQAHRLVAAIPGAELRLVDGAGHLVMHDAEEQFNRVVSGWLTG